MNDLLSEVAGYYSAKIAKYGDTPQGVDWNGVKSQQLRFEQLTRILPASSSFSINDLGCGYGALLDYLIDRHSEFRYVGCDVSSVMVEAAKARTNLIQKQTLKSNSHDYEFHVGSQPLEVADYGIASGIFNVKMERSDAEWQSYFESTVDALNQTSRLGFAFNCLTAYSDVERMQDYLHYADPCFWFDRCKQKYSKQVALLHDYGLYEFTILVRKTG